MAVAAVGTRVHESFSQREVFTLVKYALTGTYVTGGFVTPFTGVAGGPGTSPVFTKTPYVFDWQSPKGYIYYTSIAAAVGSAPPVCTTQIFSAPNTELANAAAVPDASVLCAITSGRY